MSDSATTLPVHPTGRSERGQRSAAEARCPADRQLLLQRLVRGVLRRPVRRLWALRLDGYDGIPAHGAAILCPNHLSFVDSVFLIITLERPVHFVGKVEYLDSWRTRRLFPALGMIPIDRAHGARAAISLDVAGEVLGAGGLLCIFPEGSRSRDGNLHRGYTGAARLALARRCPILPVGISGTDHVQPPGARLPRPGHGCTISIGRPILAGDGHSSGVGPGRRQAARELTDRLMHTIGELSGQTYVPAYTARTAAPSARRRGAPRFRRPGSGSWEPLASSLVGEAAVV